MAGNPNPVGSDLMAPGRSGNPLGRPKGQKNKTTLLKQAIEAELTEKLAMDADSILMKAIELAKAGDVTCIKLLMDRLLPVMKASGADDKGGVGSIHIHVQAMPDSSNTGLTIDLDNEDYSNVE